MVRELLHRGSSCETCMKQTMNPKIVPIHEVTGDEAGGKAMGLARLAGISLRVPEGFVVVGAGRDRFPEGLDEAYRAMGGGRVAVRSSARGEDGRDRSFAGQYETVLNVEGPEALRRAIDACLKSLHAGRAAAYRDDGKAGEGDEAGAMSVVVQRMVDARAAGVLFTVDPVTGGREPVVVDAVSGLGDSLVAGKVTPDHYRVTRRGRVITRDPAGQGPVLTDGELDRLVREALLAEAHWGAALDLEWAIDGRGELFWLQARPVTALDGDVHELDCGHGPDDVYTRSNIGEMIPGAVTPLTLSTTVFGIDQGIQFMQKACGARKSITRELQTLGVFYGHLFFNLTAMLDFCDRVGGSSPRTLALAIVGRAVPELGEGNPASALTRGLNGLRYLRYVLTGPGRVEALRRRLASMSLPKRNRAADMYGEIDKAMPALVETTIVHLQSSATSGLMAGLLEGIAARGAAPTAEQEAAVAALLAGAGEVESADLVRELDGVVQAAAAQEAAAGRFTGVEPGEALSWLQGGESGEAGRAFRRFLERHGHRSFRELSMRQPCWEDDPFPLIVSMQASAAGLRAAPARTGSRAVGDGKEADLPVPAAVRSWLKARSQAAVRQRERSKSMLVDVTNRFKRAYRHLSGLMVDQGLLPDKDLMYFLTHDEIGRLVRSPDPGLAAKAAKRRSAHARQRGLEFPPLFQGMPVPMEPAPKISRGEVVLAGKPVSRGVVEGTARVVRTLEEAAAVRPGEILIAPMTDVGWTPCFNLIAGIATDLGSVISHGAVIAREYGLPAVVNLKTATRTFRTGDRVVLDGDSGILKRISPAGHAEHGGDGKETSPCLRNSTS